MLSIFPFRTDYYKECVKHEGKFYMTILACPEWTGFDQQKGQCTDSAWAPAPVRDNNWYLFSDPYPPCRESGVSNYNYITYIFRKI